MTRPLTISIALCTYNGERFLQEQLDSFLQQTRLPDELVVCDDGSTDATVSMLEAFAVQAPFPVRLSINPQNLGFTKNFEKAISLCQGEIIAMSDQDDVWLPEKLDKFEQIFMNRPQLGYVLCNAQVVDQNLRDLGFTSWDFLGFTKRLQMHFCQGKAIEIVLKYYIGYGATTAFRSKLREVILPIPRFWHYDAWITFVVPLLCEVTISPEAMNKYRQHSAQCTGIRNINVFDKLLSPSTFLNDINMWKEAYSVLSKNNKININSNYLSSIESKVSHLSARYQMPSNRLSRLKSVFRELFTGRYHRYSNGLKSCAKDIIQPPKVLE